MTSGRARRKLLAAYSQIGKWLAEASMEPRQEVRLVHHRHPESVENDGALHRHLQPLWEAGRSAEQVNKQSTVLTMLNKMPALMESIYQSELASAYEISQIAPEMSGSSTSECSCDHLTFEVMRRVWARATSSYPVFSRLSETDQTLLFSRLENRTVQSNQLVCSKERDSYLRILLDGELECFIESPGTDRIFLGRISAGSIFGLERFNEHEPRRTSIEATKILRFVKSLYARFGVIRTDAKGHIDASRCSNPSRIKWNRANRTTVRNQSR